MRAYIATTLIATALLAGCAPTEQQFETTITMLQGSARARSEFVNKCTTSFSAPLRHNVGVIANVSDKDAPRVSCDRMLKAFVSGRLNYQDLVDISKDRYTPKLVKVLQGR